jgi:transcriptional regulator with XRE-family HTH domain
VRTSRTSIVLPIPVRRAPSKLGQNIREARLRRRIPVAVVADRASISRMTLNKVEKGDSGVVLGMVDRLSDLADVKHDVTGLQLQEEPLPQRIRTPRSSKPKKPGLRSVGALA